MSAGNLPLVLSGSVEIACSAAEAFDYVSDLRNYAQWFPGIAYMRPVDDAPLGVGKRYSEVALVPPNDRPERIAVEVVAYDPGRHFAIHASLAPPLPRFDYTFTALTAARCRFDWTCRTRGRGLIMPIARAVMRRVLRPRLALALANLRRILERKPDASMTAAVIRHFGAAEDVFDVTPTVVRPVAGKGQVLVRQIASSLNAIDVHRSKGYGRALFNLRKAHGWPLVLGEDICGEVVAVGPGVRSLQPGDRVFGAKPPSRDGAFASYVAVNAAHLAKLPRGVDPAIAAALPYAFLTAWSALVNGAGLRPGDAAGKRVFVQGGAGGVGAMAIQLAKAWGAEVAASGRPRQREAIKSLGADLVFDGAAGGYETLKDFDVALCCAQPAEEAQMLSILKQDGRATYATVIHPTLALADQFGVVRGLMKARAERRALEARARAVRRRASWVVFAPQPKGLAALAQMAVAGSIRATIARRFPLAEIAHAVALFEAGGAGGKIVIDIGRGSAS